MSIPLTNPKMAELSTIEETHPNTVRRHSGVPSLDVKILPKEEITPDRPHILPYAHLPYTSN